MSVNCGIFILVEILSSCGNGTVYAGLKFQSNKIRIKSIRLEIELFRTIRTGILKQTALLFFFFFSMCYKNILEFQIGKERYSSQYWNPLFYLNLCF